MSNKNAPTSLEQKIAAYEKSYKKEALAKCSLCDEALVKDPCTQECSRVFHAFKQAQRMFFQKYNKCLATATGDRDKKACEAQGNKDFESLLNLMKRFEKEQESIQGLEGLQQKD